jgi:hypothetical protein
MTSSGHRLSLSYCACISPLRARAPLSADSETTPVITPEKLDAPVSSATQSKKRESRAARPALSRWRFRRRAAGLDQSLAGSSRKRGRPLHRRSLAENRCKRPRSPTPRCDKTVTSR